MPKMKTKSGAKKRFKFSATGKIKTGKAYKGHRLIKQVQAHPQRTLHEVLSVVQETQRVKRWMPYA